MMTHRLRGLLVLLAMLPMVWLTGCSKSSNSATALTYISIAPTSITLFPGGTQQLTVTAHYSDGTTAPATSGVTFWASAPTIATVGANGLLTAVGAGTGTVSAAIGDKSADAVVSVAPTFFPVFTDGYGKGVTFVAFGGSTNALTLDSTEHHGGSASLKVEVPATGYTGGALTAPAPTNLSLYNAMTFWAKASKAATLNVAGFGNDGVGGPSFSVEAGSLPLTTTWTKFTLPIPVPSKLTSDIGLFHFAEGADEGAYTIWLDDIQYENLGSAALGAPTAAAVGWAPINVEIGKTEALPASNTVTYALPAIQLSNVSIRYFTLTSSAPAIATVGNDGTVTGIALGTASLSAKLGAMDVPGTGSVSVIAPIVPTDAPPRPTVAADKVISLLSKAYTNVPVDTWGTSWSNGNAGPNLTELVIGGDDVKKYTKLGFVGVEFTGAHVIDATGMTYFHLDVWTPDMSSLTVKLVDFGADGAYGGGDDTEATYTATASSMPALSGQKKWVSLDIPLANFIMNKKHLAQLLFVAVGPDYGVGTVYVDNVYFHNSLYIDTVPPTVAITDNVSGTTATGDVTFTFTFSEDVGTSFTASDVTVTGGTPGAFAQVSPTLYTLVVKPPANTVGTIEVSIPAGAFSDLANNANTAAATASQAYDTNLPTTPVAAPARPMLPAANVISLLSDAYTNHAVDSWRTDWSNATLTDVLVAADHVKKYSALNFVGIETVGANLVNASAMKFVHFDIWTPDATVLKFKIVDFGADAAYGGGDDTEHELTFDATTTPALVQGSWVSFDIPFSAFTNLTSRSHLAQYIFSAGGATVFLDNFYFYDSLLPMDLPVVTFDSATIAYGLKGFGGAEDSSVALDPTGGSNKVAKVVKSATAELWAGTTLTVDGTLGFAHRIPFDAAHTKMTARVYSPDAGIKVRLKVEDHANGAISCETEATTTVANAWETLTFDFTNFASGTPALDLTKSYDKASIFFNFGVTGGTAGLKTYYFDDVAFDEFSTITFDAKAITYTLAGFGGAEDSSVAADPAGGTNKVAKVVKSGTAELWAGTTVALGTANNAVGRLPFSTTATRMMVRVYSPDAGIHVRLKVEDAANSAMSCETEAITTTSKAWETLVFDFTNAASGTAALDVTKTYNKVSIFFNFGVTGATAGAKTYYFDDVTFDAFVSPVTFDSSLMTYSLAGFGGAEDSTLVGDPAGASSNQVAKVVKSATAELWAGTTVSTGANASIGKIPFSATTTKMSVRVYSPDAGIKVRLKVEDASNGSMSCETEATTTQVNTWETLTFDFLAPASGTSALDTTKTYNKASIFFNFGVTGATAGAKTYYFDDLALIP